MTGKWASAKSLRCCNMCPPLLACQEGQVVTIRITTEQLKLLARATNYFLMHTFTPDTQDMKALHEMCKDAATYPGGPDTIHGFAL
jgi:hypothetical protein